MNTPNTIKDGGPAFPVPPPIAETDGVMMQWRYSEGGMTLRDYFAGQALANLYTHSEHKPDNIAEWAYQVADAMLKAREVKP